MRLTKEDFIEHGFTAGCPGCNAIGVGDTTARNHNAECRARMNEALEQKKEQWVAVEVWLFLVRGLTGCCG